MSMASYDDEISEPDLTEFTTNVYFESTCIQLYAFWKSSPILAKKLPKISF